MRSGSSMLGSVSVMVILLVVCLSVLGASALSSALNEYRLSQRNASFAVRYYQLDMLAQDGVFEAAAALRSEGAAALEALGWSVKDNYFTRDFVLEGEPALYLTVTLGAVPDADGRPPVLEWRLWQHGVGTGQSDVWASN